MGKGIALFNGCVIVFCVIAMTIFADRGDLLWVRIEGLFIVLNLIFMVINLADDSSIGMI